jgi:uncharacterized protein YcbX
VHRQSDVVSRGWGTIFANNEYPEATMRWLDTFIEGYFGIQVRLGKFGYGLKKPVKENSVISNVPD